MRSAVFAVVDSTNLLKRPARSFAPCGRGAIETVRSAPSRHPRYPGADDDLKTQKTHQLQDFLQLHRGLAVFNIDKEAVAGVAKTREVELLQGEVLAPVADQRTQLRGRMDHDVYFIFITDR